MLPIKLHEPIANTLGRLMFRALVWHRKTVLRHLEIAFGNSKTPEELAAIALRADQNMVKNMFEFIRFPSMNMKDIQRIVTYEGEAKKRASKPFRAASPCLKPLSPY